MYNTDIPTRAELPTSKQLLRSTFFAMLAAAAILVTIVLPAEYAIDPTGIGRALRLTEMGEIKGQLAKEAEADRVRDREGQTAPATDKRSGLMNRILSELVIGSAAAQTAPAVRKHEMSVTLKPGEGAEIKLAMRKGAKANFSWTVAGGVVNFDLHGDNGKQETSYLKGRAAPSASGVVEAAFDGHHGWFWRNRGNAPVTVTLRADGEFSEMKRMM